jgi:hypothetical protein
MALYRAAKLYNDQLLSLSDSRKEKLMVEKWDFSLSKKEVLKTTEEYLNKNRIISFKEIIPGDEVSIKLTPPPPPKFSLKDPQSVETQKRGGEH